MSRVHSLLARHQNLEAQIAEEQGRPLPDQPTLSALKRRKLQVKEALVALA